MKQQKTIEMIPEFFDEFPKKQWTPEIAKKAVERNPWNLMYVPKRLRTDELYRIAINYGVAIEYIPQRLMKRSDYLHAVKVDLENLRYVPERFLTPKFYFEVAKNIRESLK